MVDLAYGISKQDIIIYLFVLNEVQFNKEHKTKTYKKIQIAINQHFTETY